jgi:hypothetical protein
VVAVNWTHTGDTPTARVTICLRCYDRDKYRKRKEARIAAALDTKAKGV